MRSFAPFYPTTLSGHEVVVRSEACHFRPRIPKSLQQFQACAHSGVGFLGPKPRGRVFTVNQKEAQRRDVNRARELKSHCLDKILTKFTTPVYKLSHTTTESPYNNTPTSECYAVSKTLERQPRRSFGR